MKKLKLTLVAIVTLGTTMFIACSDDLKDSEFLETQNLQSKDVSITLYADVVKSLANMGTERLTDYSDPYPPLFEDFKRIEYYKDSRDGTIYVLYVYDNNLNPNVASAQQNCTKAWHSGGNGTDEGCYDSGSDCDLELRNGQVIVICCDDEQEPLIT